ncbi:ATP-dependent DNA ligase [Telmatospirillum sp. J64-1]|uniref:ATP-dependent DNA ligase n=1 Tax=Telmatospirillum sp. J64-1 TaxID=2502183 RepID=UPI001C8F9B36|nr:ATP-dependent DNA ligase [Telmatospirillum sp. J64-1]
MALPLDSSLAPMEARLVDAVPEGEGWLYEPKWDGFRCLCFRDGDRIDMRSKAHRPLAANFPEIAEALLSLEAKRFVLDGEIVVPEGEGVSFEHLQQRLHPGARPISQLSRDHPALLIVFDMLVDSEGMSLVDLPLAERHLRLVDFARRYLTCEGICLSPSTTDPGDAQRWFDETAGSLDGIVAKRLDLPYLPGERTGMEKYKRIRTADCVIDGFRWDQNGREVGALRLGLYDSQERLRHVGFTAAIEETQRRQLTPLLVPLLQASPVSAAQSGDWLPVRPEVVVEVGYGHVSGTRFRNGAHVVRWRPDKLPQQCRLEQIAMPSGAALRLL